MTQKEIILLLALINILLLGCVYYIRHHIVVLNKELSIANNRIKSICESNEKLKSEKKHRDNVIKRNGIDLKEYKNSISHMELIIEDHKPFLSAYKKFASEVKQNDPKLYYSLLNSNPLLK